MPIFDITVAITGTAFGQVVAESAEHARDMFDSGDAIVDLVEWDTSVEAHRGGFVDIAESRTIEVDPVFEEDKEWSTIVEAL
jgi:hypothetical protein